MTDLVEASIEVALHPEGRRAREGDKRCTISFDVPNVGASKLSDAIAVTLPDRQRLVLRRYQGRLYLPFAGTSGWYDGLLAEEGANPEAFRRHLQGQINEPIPNVLIEHDPSFRIRARTGWPKGDPDRAAAYTRRAAVEHFLFVDGRLHRRLLEPVWQLEKEYVAPDYHANYRMKLKVHPSGYERIPTGQFRFDRREAAAGFLRRLFARTRTATIDERLVGHIESVDPDFAPCDDEIVRCVQRHGATFVILAERALGILSDRSVSDWSSMREDLALVSSEGRSAAERFGEAFERIVAEAKRGPQKNEAIRNLVNGRWYISEFLDRFAFEREIAPVQTPAARF